jgi:hypothetical protein
MKKTNWIFLAMLLGGALFFTPSCILDDPCAEVECLNGGACMDGTCNCPDGFSGDNCEIEDTCLTGAVTCQNGGTCVDGTCECPDGYVGTNCENFDPAFTQQLLDDGKRPLELYNGGVPLDSLYGKNFQGGIIFFVNIEPDSFPFFSGEGLVTTPIDYGDFTPWGCYNEETGATGSEVGQGVTNTQTIIDKMCNSAPSSIQLCYNLELNGYDDWFMPSIEEVNLMYYNLHLKGHSYFLGNIYTRNEVVWES